jgi:hypothetical protein
MLQDFDGNVAVLHHMVTAVLQLTVEKTLMTVLKFLGFA